MTDYESKVQAKVDEIERVADLAASRRMVQLLVETGHLVRMTDGRLIEAANYNPLWHGPKDELDD